MSLESKRKKREEEGEKAGSIKLYHEQHPVLGKLLKLNLAKVGTFYVPESGAKELIMKRKPAPIMGYLSLTEAHAEMHKLKDLVQVGRVGAIKGSERFAVALSHEKVPVKLVGIPIGYTESLRRVVIGGQVKTRLVYFRGKIPEE